VLPVWVVDAAGPVMVIVLSEPTLSVIRPVSIPRLWKEV
jgi:hypothetical protein